MRLATWNIEWFDRLFDDADRLRTDDGRSGREGVTAAEQAEAIAHVLRAVDPDAVLIVEAPDSSRVLDGVPALAAFAQAMGLRQSRVLMGFPSDTRQELALLFDPRRIEARFDPQGGDPPRFDGTFSADPGGDGHPEPVRWSKPPLEVALATPDGARLRLLGVHAKSKAPHGARDEDHARRIAAENRRKQLAQCLWLRARIDRHLAAGDPVVVLGDLNDGPGLDEHEAPFGRSGVEIVLGEGDRTRLYDPHAARALRRPGAAQAATARFRLPPENGTAERWLSALLDFAMVSPDLRERHPRWRVWHPFDDPGCWHDPALRRALLHASDHYPVSLDLDL